MRAHLRKCAYRGENGTKCAVGCLIPDDKYYPAIEGITYTNSLIVTLLPEMEYTFLLRELQLVHDKSNPSDWAVELSSLAVTFNLNADVLGEFHE